MKSWDTATLQTYSDPASDRYSLKSVVFPASCLWHGRLGDHSNHAQRRSQRRAEEGVLSNPGPTPASRTRPATRRRVRQPRGGEEGELVLRKRDRQYADR